MFNFNPDIIVIDNFYSDPVSVRQTALTCEYNEKKHDDFFKFGNAPWPGRMSKTSYSPKNLDLHISKLLNKPLRQYMGLNSGKFRYSLHNDDVSNAVHMDNCAYAGVLYLSNNVNDMPGTIFYTNKKTNLDQGNTSIFEKLILNGECDDENFWYKNFVSYIIFNRLIIYPGNKFHGIGPMFGTDIESSRLVQLFFWEEL